jgi:hypothetical protein
MSEFLFKEEVPYISIAFSKSKDMHLLVEVPSPLRTLPSSIESSVIASLGIIRDRGALKRFLWLSSPLLISCLGPSNLSNAGRLLFPKPCPGLALG